MFSHNKDFYPTPERLFYKLLNGTRFLRGRILEPSAGKGDLIKHIKKLNRYKDGYKVDAIEKDKDLVGVLQSDGINVVWDDFLTYETFKEYDHIIMNPPFTEGVDHALKAIRLAEKQLTGCEIYIILNKETIDNAYSDKRKELLDLLSKHDAEIDYVKDGFRTGERKTDVEVALIRASLPMVGNGESVYNKIPFFNHSPEKSDVADVLSTFVKSNELHEKLNDIERLITEYEKSCELVRESFEAQRAKESFISYVNNVNSKDGFLRGELNHVIYKKHTAEDMNEELDKLRRGFWQLILETDELQSMLTNEGIQMLNRRLNLAEEMEINRQNVKMLLMAIKMNQTDILIESIVAIFKRITQYHMNEYSSNIHYYNGWKSNNAYKISKKIVIPIKHQFDRFDFKDEYERINMDARNFIKDITKALQLIEPSVSEEFTTISEQEFENDSLRFKMFKNGNIHVWFKDLSLLNRLNYLCGSHFNWIPSEDEQKFNPEAKEFVEKEFKELDKNNMLISV